MNKILIIIVTHNRINLLKRCISYCLDINYDHKDILIVNNNSTDGTKDFLKKQKFQFIDLNENLGSAMGWHEGLKYALNKNYDYVWLMDDDGYPEKNSLKLLLDNFSKDYSCISSIVVSEDNNEVLVFSMPYKTTNNNKLIKNKTKKINLIKKFANNNIFEFAHLFNGSLIRTETIKKIGNVNKNYFMYGDELDYFYRLRKIGKVVTHVNALHIHPNVENRKCSKFWIYYYLKNSIIINKKYRNNYLLRSIAIILLCIYRVLLRNGFFDVISLLFFNKYNFYNAIFNGFKNKIGNDYK